MRAVLAGPSRPRRPLTHAPSPVISVVRLDKGNFAGAKLPHYEALRGERPPDLETTVILPESVFRGQWGLQGEPGARRGCLCRRWC